MAEPKADRSDVDEPQEALSRLIVACCDAPGVLELVEAPLDQVAQAIERTVHADAFLSGFAHRDDRQHIALFHFHPDAVGVISAIRQQHAGTGQVVGHDQIETEIVGCLARRDLRPHGQTMRVDKEVDLGREATS